MLLPSPPTARPVSIETPTLLRAQPGAVELGAVWVFFVAMTLSPLLLLILAANG